MKSQIYCAKEMQDTSERERNVNRFHLNLNVIKEIDLKMDLYNKVFQEVCLLFYTLNEIL